MQNLDLYLAQALALALTAAAFLLPVLMAVYL